MHHALATDTFALSPMQAGMLFHYLKEPHSGVDIEQVVLHLPEAVDHSRLQAAWHWLVERHEMLRAQFVWENSAAPCQEVVSISCVPFAFEDLSARAVPEQQERLKSFLESDRLRGFELNRAPLLRLTLFRWADASFSLVWTFHHALIDGRSFPALLREVFEAYEELANGWISTRPVPGSYRRHIEWLATQDFSAAESFWKKHLSGFVAPTPLVIDRQTPDKRLYAQGEAWHVINQEDTRQLRSLASTHGLTMNSLVMGAWAMLLHRYSGEHDIVFGATRACRKSSVSGADDVVGIFINSVPVRVTVTSEQAALSVFESTRETWKEIRPFEHTPLALVKAVSEIPPAQPLFESLIVFENYHLDAVMRSLGGAWAARRVELHELTSFPITLAAYDGEELSFKIEFDQRRLDEQTIRSLLLHLAAILQAVAIKPNTAVSDLPLLTLQERETLIAGFNAPERVPVSGNFSFDREATLNDLFEAAADRHANDIALTCNGYSLTYAELNAQANRVAHALVRLGIQPDTLVGLFLERSTEMVVAILGILKAGGAYLPIDPAYPAERLAFILEDAQAPVLLTENKAQPDLPKTRAMVLCIDQLLAQPAVTGEEDNLPPIAGPDHLAYVIYTSGTTGKPKGSLITHRNVARLFASTEAWFGFNASDVWTLFHSCAFDFSVWEIWGALLYGGRIVVVPYLVSRSPEAFYELLAREQVTVLNQTPSAFRQLIQAEEMAGHRELALRYVIFGGEALEMQSLRPWFDQHGDQKPRLVNMYGITETTVHVTYRPLSKNDLNSGSVIGIPIPDLRIYILDRQRQPVPIGVPGEMYVGGAGLARGYLRRPDLTEERFVPDHLTGEPGARLYRTGDLARFLPGRDIEYLGRIDNQVKIRGFRIELGEIESALCQHPAVREAVVLARQDAPGDKRLVAYLTAPGGPISTSDLRSHLKKTLPDYMVPAAFVFLPGLPLTNHGKIDRDALPAPEEQRPELTDGYIAPRTAAEQKLAAIWSKVLRVEQVGINDNFFELGGDSILSIQIISLARLEGLTLTPKLLFMNQTIAGLAAAADAGDAVQPGPEAAVGDVPLTPIQRWFFEKNPEECHYYNQAFLLQVNRVLERPLLEQALKELSRQHESLRLRFVREAGVWKQYYAVSEEPVLSWESLAGLEDGEKLQRLEQVATLEQAGLRIGTGPAWRAAFFDMGDGLPGRLLIVVHHLAVDGISWRPLLEDLETCYQQLSESKPAELPPRTTPYKSWAKRLVGFAESERLLSELPYWEAVTDPQRTARTRQFLHHPPDSGMNTESSTGTWKVSLTRDETRALLQEVPAAYNTQINDVLLTALARAWNLWSGNRILFTHLEGHGRENLFDDVDLSRTMGWFTSIFPVLLELPEPGKVWQPGTALKSVKEQLRKIPQRGIGYGILRYLSKDGAFLGTRPDPQMVFNYLGQFDQVLAGSELFRFAAEPIGPWHSPKQRRPYALELNSLITNGCFELSLTYSRNLHQPEVVRELSSHFIVAMRELIVHCQSPHAGGYTPSDFPMAGLDQQALGELTAGWPGIEDIYPLSPIQTLFLSANQSSVRLALDHWKCTLRGPLDVAAFQRAWKETLQRHSILRSTFHTEGLREPVQMVHREVQPQWQIEDWRQYPAVEHAGRWNDLLKQDHARPLTPTQAPVMRFTLVRLADEVYRFLWSVPALLLDGWSWPTVFRDTSGLYEAYTGGAAPALGPVRPYRDYIEWLKGQSSSEARQFWQVSLAGFRKPTALHGELPQWDGTGDRHAQHAIQLTPETTADLQATARRLQTTLNVLVQGAWAILLRRQSGDNDIVFGAAFAGRPTDLRFVESIAGPFVNNLPVRVVADGTQSAGDFLRRIHKNLLEINSYQFTPLVEIQDCSEVPFRDRLFDSLVVFQNYVVDESARSFGGRIAIEDFTGPIHTNYPVLLLAEPRNALRLTLIYDQATVSFATVEHWAEDLATLLDKLPRALDWRIADLEALLSLPVAASATPTRKLRKPSQNYVLPQTDMERTIAAVWEKIFGQEQVGTEDNFFDLGAHSLLLVQTHAALQVALKAQFPVVALFEHPTIRSLARHLSQPSAAGDNGQQWKELARRQKQAVAHLRVKLNK